MASNIVVHGTTDNADPAAAKPILKLDADGSLASAQLPASLGIKTAAASLSVAPASDANVARETYTTVTITSVTTAATGTNWTAFASLACTQLDLVNNTGVTIEYRRGAAGTAFQIPHGAGRLIQGITNASQIDVRRVDQSNTQVTAYAEGFVV